MTLEMAACPPRSVDSLSCCPTCSQWWPLTILWYCGNTGLLRLSWHFKFKPREPTDHMLVDDDGKNTRPTIHLIQNLTTVSSTQWFWSLATKSRIAWHYIYCSWPQDHYRWHGLCVSLWLNLWGPHIATNTEWLFLSCGRVETAMFLIYVNEKWE